MKRYFTIVLLPLLLTACADPVAQAEHQRMLEAQDTAECTKLGFQPGTDAFGNCRLKLMEIRSDDMNSRRVQTSIGVGYGGGHGHYW